MHEKNPKKVDGKILPFSSALHPIAPLPIGGNEDAMPNTTRHCLKTFSADAAATHRRNPLPRNGTKRCISICPQQ
jgi:hypothetical protein